MLKRRTPHIGPLGHLASVCALLLALVLTGPDLRAGEAPQPQLREIAATRFIGVTREVFPEEIAAHFQEASALIASAFAEAGAEPAGPLHFLGPAWNGAGKRSVFIVAYPVAEDFDGTGLKPPLLLWTEPAARVASLVIEGDNHAVSAAWETMLEAVRHEAWPATSRWIEVQLRFTSFDSPQNQIELRLVLEPAPAAP